MSVHSPKNKKKTYGNNVIGRMNAIFTESEPKYKEIEERQHENINCFVYNSDGIKQCAHFFFIQRTLETADKKMRELD